MLLRELFNLQLSLTEEALSTDQVESAFTSSCLIFFSDVKPVYRTTSTVDISVGFKDTTNVLGLDIGKFEIKEIVPKEDYKLIRVTPLEFSTFDLAIEYNNDFMLVCEYLILQTSLKNINMLKNLGIDEMVQQLPMDLQSLRATLRQSFSIETGIVC